MSGRRRSRRKSRCRQAAPEPGNQMPLKHILVIADGNRRWARKNETTHQAAYGRSVKLLREAVKWLSVDEGIPVVSFYLMSDYNFTRPQDELVQIYAAASQACAAFHTPKWDVRYKICGSLDKFPPELSDMMEGVENVGNGSGNIVNLLVGYSGMRDLQSAMAACQADNEGLTEENLLKHSALGPKPIDVLIRTGGVVRLSDGPLIGISQTRMYALNKLFPEIRKGDLMSVIKDYRSGRRV